MKDRRIEFRVEQDLYDAIAEVAIAEGKTKSDIVLPILRDIFLDLPSLSKKVRVPILGYIINNDELGNVVILKD